MNFVFSIVYILAIALNIKLDPTKKKGEVEASHFLFTAKSFQYLHLNYKSVISNSLWIQMLPKIDMIAIQKLDLSWQYNVIDTITDLSPRMRYAYRNGGEILSVLVDDKEGAKKIFDKGIQIYPNYWPLLYSAAFHYMSELKQLEKAAKFYNRAFENGGPDWLPSLIAELYSEAGQKKIAIQTLKSYLRRFPQGKSRERIQNKLKNLMNQP